LDKATTLQRCGLARKGHGNAVFDK